MHTHKYLNSAIHLNNFFFERKVTHMNIIFDLSGVLFGTQTSKPCSIQNRFACALRPINPVNSLKLLHDCIQSGHRLFIVSNLTAEDFDFLKADPQALRVFNYFEDIVLAGKVGIQKPDPRIFNYLLEKHGLDPHSSVFIDDEAVNLYGAEQAGITKGILCSDHNFNSIRQELELHGAL